MNYLDDGEEICEICCCYVGLPLQFHMIEDCDKFRREWAEDLWDTSMDEKDNWRYLQKNMALVHLNWFHA